MSVGELPPRELSPRCGGAAAVPPGALQAYFDSSVDGLEKVPDGPALVANHSGGSTPVESIVFVVEYLDRLGVERPLYWLGHDALLRLPVVGDFVRRCGVIPAGWDVAADTLRGRSRAVVYPGGRRARPAPAVDGAPRDPLRGPVGVRPGA